MMNRTFSSLLFRDEGNQYRYYDEEDLSYILKEKIEHIGNKLPFEKKLNIIAGNGYFVKKKKEYVISNIAITKNFGESSSSDWTLDDITERDLQVSTEVIDTLTKWKQEYNTPPGNSLHSEATPEELAMIEEFKKRGLI